ncbi:hypothetical protein J5N97_013248 [Dioscorea zingiberensis]|uniref:Uncharacterized protein n=1 Tax=Dioscorea zingiberensis TaxID=325984 RepID=A0A9D5CRU5_9LILI|nr:hypothetical protein J5N97_013248 [Dioscorea zingiberensis]
MKTRMFNMFISHNYLTELRHLDSPFTWCNNQQGGARISAKLDRILANNKWLSDVPTYHVKHLTRSQSDHTPILIDYNFEKPEGRRPFRFENTWIQEQACRESVRRIWRSQSNGNPLQGLSHKFSNLRKDLLRNCSRNSMGWESKIKKLEEQLSRLETKECTQGLEGMETGKIRSMYNQYHALLRQNTTMWAQRSRLKWLQNGDNNSRFFHQTTRRHRANNKINQIKTELNITIEDPKGIEEEFITFYSKLWQDQ